MASYPRVIAADAVARIEAEFGRLRTHRRVRTALFGALFAGWFGISLVVGEASPAKLIQGLPRITEYIGKTLPTLRWSRLGEDIQDWFYGLSHWLGLLGETVLMAYLATLLGTVGALALCFLASRNLTPHPALYFVARRALEFCRTVPDLVFALIFIYAFGLGPMAGILAIALHSLGASGKLFAEANENIDLKPVEGLRGAGASWAQTMRFAVLPQVLPNFASYTLWRFEINVRTAAVMGFVGAGGIGHELMTAIRMLYYEDISALILILILTVSIIDILCERMRHGLMGREAAA